MPSDVAPTLVLAAMPEELAPLRARLTDLRWVGGADIELESGRLRGRPVVLGLTGDGARNAREGAADALACTGARALIAVGVAGALSPGLFPRELVIAERVLREFGSPLQSERALVDAAARATGGVAGTVLTALRIADSVAEKRRLLKLAHLRDGDGDGGGGGAAVVDLESAAYAEAATAEGIPWLVLRAVSDTADEALPALLNRALDDGGAIRRGRVLAGLLGQPSALPQLLGLRRRVRASAEVLAEGVEALLAADVFSMPATTGQDLAASEG